MDLSEVSRFEVIDHRPDGFGGRALIVYEMDQIYLSLQDDGKTLKVFLA